MRSGPGNAARRKGIFFTLAIILLLIPLMMLVSFYVTTSKTRIDDETSQLRCDELHYFVEDVKKDLSRAVVIFGRRAAIYSSNYVVMGNSPLQNYSFNCNSTACNVNCNRTIYPDKGAEAAIAELTLCGTMNNTNVSDMVNHTLKEWNDKIEQSGMGKNFNINITLKEIKVVPIDAWDFAIIITNEIDAVDNTGICYYRDISVTTSSNTSIIGLEDPLYTLKTNGAIYKTIYSCDSLLNISQALGNGTSGSANATGSALLYSTGLGSLLNLSIYCSNNTADVLNATVLVIDAGGSLACNQTIKDCVNSSSPKHFAGVVEKGANNLSCSPLNQFPSIPSITNATNFTVSADDCLYLRNYGAQHTIVAGIDCRDVNYSCYSVSNITGNEAGCSGTAWNDTAGPSFFDRLDGMNNLSAKYVNQSTDNYRNPNIGIETIIDYNELVNHEIDTVENATWIDYLYWKQVNGTDVCGVCSEAGTPYLKLDCRHAIKLNISTGC